MDKEKFKRRKIDIFGKCFEIALLVFVLIYCVSLLIPLLWMILGSLKTYEDYLMSSFGIPQMWEFENYLTVFEVFKVPYIDKNGVSVRYNFIGMAEYSLLYTFGKSFFHVIMCSMCAYALAKFKFPGNNLLYSIGVLVMIVPIIGSGPSGMMLSRSLGIYNNMLPNILTSESCAFSGMHFMVLYAAFKRVPITYSEAVKIDGGNNYTVLFKVILPMALPTLVDVFVLQFLACWNDYNTFLVYLPSYPSLAVGMYLFEQTGTSSGVPMPVILATFVVVIVPTSLLYILTQKILLNKFTVGGLKG